ncbi:hypothetical protein D6C78_00404 [Aureobasidium pullulans]|uniref:Uncharacterized protein n=2 Tax=Aureobasidium pullulans TaxID=5580 RepID=A0A074XEZ4_AURPU|nr:uncharacterized protein M438DRAFT_277968 [Aureobasidium pullulans EXF-150]KEQ82309.1 hypothetical protein M438DRAFT_277968 [Aureobasidium pullulans EXF-150]THX10583.1 hypothetical protein D6D18_00948 [Aureobasidium pullulans]TIA43271.1 hypothetical protein D6C78_00404 [Aureobasidium pullulans]
MLKVADILSDLTSLRVGDPVAAMDLVLARSPITPAGISTQQLKRAQNTTDSDVDLARAQDLLDLHANVKLAHRGGLDRSLLQARQQVNTALRNV